jgi:DNA integrity scanning protein DisA with diadenylate cyclase activity
MRTVIKTSTVKSRNIVMMQVEALGPEERELRLQARELGKGLRLEREEIAAIIDAFPF